MIAFDKFVIFSPLQSAICKTYILKSLLYSKVSLT
jgi:hypothetical protein